MLNERSTDLTWQVQWTTSTDGHPCLSDPVQFESWIWKLIQSQKSSVVPFVLSVSPRINNRAGQSFVSENIYDTLMNIWKLPLTLTLSELYRKPSYYPEADVTLVQTPSLELLAHIVPSIEQHNLRTHSARTCSRSLYRSDSNHFWKYQGRASSVSSACIVCNTSLRVSGIFGPFFCRVIVLYRPRWAWRRGSWLRRTVGSALVTGHDISCHFVERK